MGLPCSAKPRAPGLAGEDSRAGSWHLHPPPLFRFNVDRNPPGAILPQEVSHGPTHQSISGYAKLRRDCVKLGKL